MAPHKSLSSRLTVLRLLMLCAVALGLVLPKSTALIAPLFNARAIVICTGAGLETVLLDKSGAPVRALPHADPCALVHASLATAAPELVTPRSLGVGLDITPTPTPRRSDLHTGHNLARAPPRA